MSDKSKYNPEKLSIVDFKCLKGQVDAPEDFILEKISSYNVENSLALAVNMTDKRIKVDFTITIISVSNGANKHEASGSFHLIFIYHLENLDEMAEPADGNIIRLDPVLTTNLASVSYSTSRGILLTRLQGTALQNFILPVINPVSLLQQPVK